jgi:hypothetical protein
MPPKIFISYRRTDSQTMTERIYERLKEAFGRDKIFKDIGSIPPGVDFRQYIELQLKGCKVMLVIIGPQWATISDDNGLHRLDNPYDFVRLEVETALMRQEIPVIPVLIPDAKTQLPSDSDLPEPLRSLRNRNSRYVRNDPDFDGDMVRLISELAPYVGKPRQPRKGVSLWQGLFVLAILVSISIIVVSLALMTSRQPQITTATIIPSTNIPVIAKTAFLTDIVFPTNPPPPTDIVFPTNPPPPTNIIFPTNPPLSLNNSGCPIVLGWFSLPYHDTWYDSYYGYRAGWYATGGFGIWDPQLGEEPIYYSWAQWPKNEWRRPYNALYTSPFNFCVDGAGNVYAQYSP